MEDHCRAASTYDQVTTPVPKPLSNLNRIWNRSLALIGLVALAACKSRLAEAVVEHEPTRAPSAVSIPEGRSDPTQIDVSRDASRALDIVELTKLGLEAEVPAGTTIGDAFVGEGVLVQGPNLVAIVEVASTTRSTTEAEVEVEARAYTPKNFKTERLADGFAVTFENEGSLGTNFFLQVRRDIGGMSYWCETTAASAEQQAAASAFCKSLRRLDRV